MPLHTHASLVLPPCSWVVALDSDSPSFAGFDRVLSDTVFVAQDEPWDGRPYSIQVYSCSRTALVLKQRSSQ